MDSSELNAELVEDLLQSPERNFARLLFETSPINVIEILSDLVLYPENGHQACVQCLYVWQDLQNNAYTMSSILDEVQNAREVNIVCACVTLVNRLLQHAPDTLKRFRIRRELEEIRFEEQLVAVSKYLVPNEQLKSSIEKLVFLLHQPSTCITFVPTVDVGYTADADSGTFSSEEDDLMNGTADESHSIKSTEVKSNGCIAGEISLLISAFDSPDALELLAKFIKQLQNAKQPPTTVLKQLNDNFPRWGDTLAASKSLTNGIPPPPPFPSLQNGISPKKPPSPFPPTTITKPDPPLPPQLKSGPPAPPPILSSGSSTAISKPVKVEVPDALKLKFVPPENKKLRHLQWTKVPINTLAPSNHSFSNVWLKMDSLSVDLLKNLDFTQLDNCFSCEPAVTDVQPFVSSEKETKSLTVSLLCGRKSLSVNVFLKSLKGMVDELVGYIQSGQGGEGGGTEKLKMLVPLLPTDEEAQTLNNYTGNRDELGPAECFLLKLLQVADYRLRIESILLREEFSVFISNIEVDLRMVIQACQELRQSRGLQVVLLILLHMGNYLNHNATLGNAVGFKLASLWKIDELRAIKGGRTLLHVAAQQAEKANANLDDIPHVKDAAKVAFEALKSELKTSVERVNKLEGQLKFKTESFFVEIKSFLTSSKKRLERSNNLLAQIESERQQLAVYFCENEKTFSLEECFKILSNFQSRFIIAAQENSQREEREKRMHERNANAAEGCQLALSKNIAADAIKSPNVTRRASVVIEQDRDRNESLLPQSSRRRFSAARRDSAIFDNFKFERVDNDTNSNQPSGDLSAFMDQALELSSRKLSARFSPLRSPLPQVQEMQEAINILNGNKETMEVKVPVSTISSRIGSQIQNKTTQPVSQRNGSSGKMVPKVFSLPTAASATIRKQLNSAATPNGHLSPATRASKIAISSQDTPPAKTVTNGHLPSKTRPQKIALSSVGQPVAEARTEPVSSPLRKQVVSRIRARQSNESPQKPQPVAPVQPLRPSQVRLNQARLSNRFTAPAAASAVSSPFVTNQSFSINQNKQLSKIDAKPTVSSTLRKVSSATRSTAATNLPKTSTVTRAPAAPATKNVPNSRTAMTATEKRGLFRQSTSLSTTSRPSLIRCGSKTEKPRWS